MHSAWKGSTNFVLWIRYLIKYRASMSLTGLNNPADQFKNFAAAHSISPFFPSLARPACVPRISPYPCLPSSPPLPPALNSVRTPIPLAIAFPLFLPPLLFSLSSVDPILMLGLCQTGARRLRPLPPSLIAEKAVMTTDSVGRRKQ